MHHGTRLFPTAYSNGFEFRDGLIRTDQHIFRANAENIGINIGPGIEKALDDQEKNKI